MTISDHEAETFRNPDTRVCVELWKFEREDGSVMFEKELHNHGDVYVSTTEEIEQEEFEKLLEKLRNSEDFEEK